ncbi:MAG TPA: DUF1127 domain-containing protein [Stellaceae bacterium]
MVDMTHHPLTNSHSKASAVIPRLVAILALWRRRIQERDQLARLGERELHDIGLSRTAVYAEIRKPFWRA